MVFCCLMRFGFECFLCFGWISMFLVVVVGDDVEGGVFCVLCLVNDNFFWFFGVNFLGVMMGVLLVVVCCDSDWFIMRIGSWVWFWFK